MKPFAAIIVLSGLLGACSPAPSGVTVHDPYEDHNREAHAFNVALSDAFSSGDNSKASFKPPTELTRPVVNFADNVGLPGMVVNGILQGDAEGAVKNSARFLINTTVGLLGLFDPATEMGLPEEETDFGETLAVWGAPEGAYLELPFLGPTTERALAGRIVDMIIDPLESVGTPQQVEYGTVAKLAGRVIKVVEAGDAISGVLDESADSYAALRLIYLQNRRFELGTTPVEDAVDPYLELYGDQ